MLDAYEGACAFWGLGERLDGKPIGLVEAAHVRWHCHDGPDVVENGLALCVLHHKAFDRGAMALGDGDHVLVSPRLSGGEAVDAALRRYAEQVLLRPRTGAVPLLAHRAWHRRQVFRAG